MNFRERFRRNKEDETPKEPVELYAEPPETSYKRWQDIAFDVHSFQVPEVRSTKAHSFWAGKPKSIEYTFPKDTVVIRTPAKDVKTHELSDETIRHPEYISVFRTSYETVNGIPNQRVRRVMFHVEPERQIFYDYTDPELPNGKQITNTAEPHFQAVQAYIHDIVWNAGESLVRPTHRVPL